METAKVTHAVPEPVQRVLDAMTEQNWRQGPGYEDGMMCFLNHAVYLETGIPLMAPQGEWTKLARQVSRLCERTYRMPVAVINDTASSLSDFKQKIIELYRVEK